MATYFCTDQGSVCTNVPLYYLPQHMYELEYGILMYILHPVQIVHVYIMSCILQQFLYKYGCSFFFYSVAFHTTPMDNTGVAHILEHTVLCGSHKYPVRDPFFKMMNRSLATFMNAFTGLIFCYTYFHQHSHIICCGVLFMCECYLFLSGKCIWQIAFSCPESIFDRLC